MKKLKRKKGKHFFALLAFFLLLYTISSLFFSKNMILFNFEIRFLFPLAFWLLVVLIPGVIFGHFRQSKQGIHVNFLSDIHKVYGTGKLRSFFLLSIEILIMILGVIALANPILPHISKETSKKGIDIILVIDISKSMLAEDITPNRIEAAKHTIDGFLGKIQNDRVGIILFAGEPFASVPLTFDYDAIRNILSEVTTDSINQTVPGLSGTAIGDAILSATDALERNTKTEEKNRTKTIILLTDGEANVGVNPLIATKYAHEKNIQIFTVGIGKTDGTPLFVTDPVTGKKQYFTDDTGKPIIASIDEKSLKSIADITGGKFFLASDSDSLKKIFTTLGNLKKSKIQTKTITTNESLVPYFIWVFLLLFGMLGYYRFRVVS